MEPIADKDCEREVSLSRIQRLIGQRMSESKRTKPCFYISTEADVTELMGMRHQLKKTTGIKITTNAFYIRALVMAAVKYPLVLASILDADNIKIADSVNVGFAVNAPKGLMVPVIKNVERMDLTQIAQAEKILTDKARANKLSLEEVSGETIALSNLGVYGIESFFGIVPPPATVILSVGNTVHKLIPLRGRIVERRLVSLSLAADHRIINGDYAALFLNYIRKLLGDPARLVNEPIDNNDISINGGSV